jgi:hypothetical protein
VVQGAEAEDPSERFSRPGAAAAGIRQVSPSTFEIGRVILDQASRTVTVPAQVNLREGLLEYVLVTETGKIHESLLTTQARPVNVHTACLLLGVKPKALAEGLKLDPKANPQCFVDIDVRWKQDDEDFCRPLESLVRLRTESATEPSPKSERQSWLYNGATIGEGPFLAQRSGSIVSLIHDPAALVNNPRREGADDEIHLPRTSELPPEGTIVKVVFQVDRSLQAQRRGAGGER